MRVQCSGKPERLIESLEGNNVCVAEHSAQESSRLTSLLMNRSVLCNISVVFFIDLKKKNPHFHKARKKNMLSNIFCDSQGQTESKKLSKQQRAAGIETKGTAMSFGFKKKLLPSNKKHDNANHGAKEKEAETLTTANANYLDSRTDNGGDDNGNNNGYAAGDEQNATGRSTPTVVAPKKESSGVPYRSTRFGFRKANIVRPSSTGLPLKVTHFDNIANNNNVSSASGRFLRFLKFVSRSNLIVIVVVSNFV